MGTHALYVRFPDGEIRHGLYYSVTDTAGMYLSDTADEAEALGWAMECGYTPDLDGTGEPVQVATSYAGYFHWPATATREWLTSNRAWIECDVETVDGVPGWLKEYFNREPEFTPRPMLPTHTITHDDMLRDSLREWVPGTPLAPHLYLPMCDEPPAPTLSPEWAARVLDQAPGVRDV